MPAYTFSFSASDADGASVVVRDDQNTVVASGTIADFVTITDEAVSVFTATLPVGTYVATATVDGRSRTTTGKAVLSADLTAAIATEAAAKWKPSTAYAAGAAVLSPAGVLVQAKAAFTSAATYDSSKWRPVVEVGDWVGNVTDAALQSWQFGTSNRLNIAFLGDSITQGAWAGPVALTDWDTKGLAAKFQQSMARVYGNGGAGFIGLWRAEWVKSGAWVQDAAFGPFGQGWKITATPAATWTLTVEDGDNVDLYYWAQTGAGAFTYTINGGAPVTITPATPGTPTLAKTNIALGSRGVHTLVVFGPAANTLTIAGAAVYIGTGGAVCHNIGKSGALVADLSTSQSSRLTPFLADLAPRLNFVGFVANDYTSQIALSVYNTRLAAVTAGAKAVGDTVVWLPPDNGVTTVGKPITIRDYENEAKAVAVAQGVPWVDIHAAWGDYAGTLPKMFDTQHPNEAGHADIAARLLRVVRQLT